jgi:heat shock protein HtpX
MFQTLPAETVFERQRQAKWRTFLLFSLLFVIYALFLNLMALAVFAIVYMHTPEFWRQWKIVTNQSLGIVLFITAIGGLAALVHYLYARAQPISKILGQLQARPADPADKIHRVFIDIVSEAELATGIRPIQAVVTPTPGYNAFAVQDAQGNCAIGVTEGLLARLEREELSAVIAHEASHLINQDSKLKTTACSLSSVFQDIQDVTGTIRGRGQAGFAQLVLWMVAGLGRFFTLVVSAVISRQLEYLADAHAVQMCQDPKALAEALYKISKHGRGGVGNSDAFSALFILNPGGSPLDEKSGFFPDIFSTHPPVIERLKRLVAWARISLPTLQVEAELENAQKPKAAAEAPKIEDPRFFAFRDKKWDGPFTPAQMMALKDINPLTWIAPALAATVPGQDEILRASDHPLLLPIFQNQLKKAVSAHSCPRCKTALLEREYEQALEWHCEFCQGDLLAAGVLERLVARKEKTFTPEEIKKAKEWNKGQKGNLEARGLYPAILCPICGTRMMQSVHNILTQVVIDRCMNDQCQAVWCDGGELETIQIIVENAE